MNNVEKVYLIVILLLIIVADLGLLGPGGAWLCGITPYADGIGHFVLMGMLARVAGRWTPNRGIRFKGLIFPTGAVIVALLVVIEELSQSWFPVRVVSIVDLSCDLAGMTLLGLRREATDLYELRKEKSMNHIQIRR